MPKNKKQPKKEQGEGFLTRALAVIRGEKFRFAAGLVLFLLPAIYLALSLVSFLIYGGNDFSAAASPIEAAAEGRVGYDNWGGALGGTIALGMINGWMGVSSLIVPWYLFLVSRKLFNPAGGPNLIKKFFSCAFLMIWISLLLGLVLPSNDFLPYVSFGGAHGTAAASYLSGVIGLPGLVLLLAGAMLLYLSLSFVSMLPAVRAWAGGIWEKIGSWFSRLFKKKEHPADGDDVAEEASSPENGGGDGLEGEEGDDDGNGFDVVDDEGEDSHGADRGGDADMSGDDADSEDFSGSDSDSYSDTDPDSMDRGMAADAPKNPDDVTFVVNQPIKEDTAEEKAQKLVLEEGEYDPKQELSHYVLPGLDLLEDYELKNEIDPAEQNYNKQRIVKTLKNYGISITKIEATVGPTITLYEIVPSEGTRISKIRNLSDDLAMSLSAQGIRIIAPMPGKGTIGIEVPNEKPRIVPMKQVLASATYQNNTYDLPMALGKTITNEVYMVDLCKMPHLLVAGATGQGKSVGLNAIIASLLYRKHPSQLKFVMIDPKKVEFSIYSTIENHFLAKLPDNEDPIITDVTKVVQTLKALCKEMDTRYDLLKTAQVRNIKEYNQKFVQRKLNPEKGHKFLPYIVVIIDEFGDLIMTAGKDVELPIARIAQLARAVGIHAIIATQRPTTNIITGTIKANFPARMAFRTAQANDSRTILDAQGADKLIGKGDMLFTSGNSLTRIQCAFIDTKEIERVCNFINEQRGYPTAFMLPEPDIEEGEGGAVEKDLGKIDPLFEEAARMVLIQQNGSTSMLQRKFELGYNRAARIMDQLEAAGIVGPANGSKPRQVLVQDEMRLYEIFEGMK